MPKLADPRRGRPVKAGTDNLLDYKSIAAELFLRGVFSAPPSTTTISRLEKSAMEKIRKRLNLADVRSAFIP